MCTSCVYYNRHFVCIVINISIIVTASVKFLLMSIINKFVNRNVNEIITFIIIYNRRTRSIDDEII